MTPEKSVEGEQVVSLVFDENQIASYTSLMEKVLESMASALGTMANVGVTAGPGELSMPSSEEVSLSLEGMGLIARAPYEKELSGEIAVAVPTEVAGALAGGMLGSGPVESFDEDSLDASSELFNAAIASAAGTMRETWGGSVSAGRAEVTALTPETISALSLPDELVVMTCTIEVEGIDPASFMVVQTLPTITSILKLMTDEEGEPAADGTSLDQGELDKILGDFPPEGESVQEGQSSQAPVVAPESSPMSTSVAMPPGGLNNLDLILDIDLRAIARLGKLHIEIGELLTFGPGSIIEIDRNIDEPIDILVNDKLIARGDVVVVDEKFGVRIVEVVSPLERIESLR